MSEKIEYEEVSYADFDARFRDAPRDERRLEFAKITSRVHKEGKRIRLVVTGVDRRTPMMRLTAERDAILFSTEVVVRDAEGDWVRKSLTYTDINTLRPKATEKAR